MRRMLVRCGAVFVGVGFALFALGLAAGAASVVLTHLFPKEASRFAEAAEESARSRVLAGVVYPSDTRAGLDLGRAVAARVIEHLKLDDTKWAGTLPVGPGLWTGSTPGGVDDVRWKPFVLSSASQFRPDPPPAPDSAERAAKCDTQARARAIQREAGCTAGRCLLGQEVDAGKARSRMQ